MAGRGGAAVHPDAVVFLAPVEAHRVLHPFLGEAEILLAARWWDAGHDAVRRVCRHSWVAIPEVRPGLKAAGVGKLAGRAPHLADAVPDRRASVVRRARPEVRLALPVFVAAELYKRVADQFAV